MSSVHLYRFVLTNKDLFVDIAVPLMEDDGSFIGVEGMYLDFLSSSLDEAMKIFVELGGHLERDIAHIEFN